MDNSVGQRSVDLVSLYEYIDWLDSVVRRIGNSSAI